MRVLTSAMFLTKQSNRGLSAFLKNTHIRLYFCVCNAALGTATHRPHDTGEIKQNRRVAQQSLTTRNTASPHLDSPSFPGLRSERFAM